MGLRSYYTCLGYPIMAAAVGRRSRLLYLLLGLLLVITSTQAQDGDTVSVSCDEGEFRCHESTAAPACVPEAYVCDGNQDCAAGEDEKDNCPGLPCPDDTEFRCRDGSCIPATFRCDFIADCYDRDDEANCTYPDCAAGSFRCDNQRCVANNLTCNGNWDCGDGSDETDTLCQTVEPCTAAHFVCNNNECVNFNLVCNSVNDCSDGSDEVGCGVNECLNSTLCEHTCQNTITSYECLCPPGYALNPQDNRTCLEINECEQNPLVCDQRCSNTVGAYQCACVDGYTLDTDGRTCKLVSTDPDEPFLLFANRYYLRKMNLNGSAMSTLVSDGQLIHIFDYDSVHKHFYYADAQGGHIRRIDYAHDEAVAESVVINWHNLPLVEGIAVDWVGRKLYWTDSHYYAVAVSELNGTFVRTLSKGVSKRPRGIIVYPQKGYVYWVDWHVPPFIARMGMDGSDLQKIVTDDLFWPNGITLDPFIDRIWWADAYLDTIEYADLDGNNRYVVVRDNPHVYAITLFEQWIYLSDWNIKKLERINRFNGTDRSQIASLSHEPYDIHVVQPSLQPQGQNPCGTNNGGCSHLCLIAPGGQTFSCACPNDFELNANNRTCEPSCSAAQFECDPSDHRCIPARWVCDGEDDCKNGLDEQQNCPNRTCPVGVFQCTDHSACIYFTQQCDGTPDCSDSSDEVADFCHNRVCLDHEFLCEATGRCLPGNWECDGDSDCLDEADEQDCEAPPEGCDDDQFRCDNGNCIPASWWCDLDDDCGDNSDEKNRTVCYQQACPDGWRRCLHSYRCVPEILWCDGNNDCRDDSDEPTESSMCPPCPDGDYQCTNGQCIPLRWKCDFMEDCEDGSDEGDDNCSDEDYPPCDEGEWRCANNHCIRESYLCDGDNDCMDNSDELISTCVNHQCPRTDQFQCHSGHCIPGSYRCDQDRDCSDASDEMGCPFQSCHDYEFRCNNTVCIPASWRCDTDNDCGDNSDELLALCRAIDCEHYQRHRCDNGRCIRYNQLCDNVRQCEDGSDENDFNVCPHEAGACTDDQFRCYHNDSVCVDQDVRCDGFADCGSALDETTCQMGTVQDPKWCTINSCEHHCFNSTQNYGHYCTCNTGYNPDPNNRTRCIDINECSVQADNHCPQTCANTKGAYACTCVGNFIASGHDMDHFLCEPQDGSKGVLLAGGVAGTVFQLRIDSRTLNDAAVYGQKAYRVASHAHKNMFYWADDIKREVYRAQVPDSSTHLSLPTIVMTQHMSKPSGLAIDWIAMNLYVTDSEEGKILVCKDDGRYVTTLIQGAGRQPGYIALAPELGLMFWTEPIRRKLMRAWMDGTHEEALPFNHLENPSGVAVDHYMNNRLYFSDSKLNTIESCRPDGTDHFVVASQAHSPYGIQVMFSQMFWLNGTLGGYGGHVHLMDKFGRGVNVSLMTVYVNDFTLHHPWRFPNRTRSNPCENSECWPLCLLTPNDKSCVCPDNAEMIPGSTTTCMLKDAHPNAAGQYAQMPSESAIQDVYTCPCSETELCRNHLLDGLPTCNCIDGVEAANCITTATRSGGENPDTVIIIIIVLLVIVSIVLLIGFFIMYRRGMLTCLQKKAQGQVRFGDQGQDPAAFANPAVAAPVVSYDVSNDGLSTRFANPMYDKLNQPANGANPAPGGDEESAYAEITPKKPLPEHDRYTSA